MSRMIAVIGVKAMMYNILRYRIEALRSKLRKIDMVVQPFATLLCNDLSLCELVVIIDRYYIGLI